jgi:hypothetical protein
MGAIGRQLKRRHPQQQFLGQTMVFTTTNHKHLQKHIIRDLSGRPNSSWKMQTMQGFLSQALVPYVYLLGKGDLSQVFF